RPWGKAHTALGRLLLPRALVASVADRVCNVDAQGRVGGGPHVQRELGVFGAHRGDGRRERRTGRAVGQSYPISLLASGVGQRVGGGQVGVAGLAVGRDHVVVGGNGG